MQAKKILIAVAITLSAVLAILLVFSLRSEAPESKDSSPAETSMAQADEAVPESENLNKPAKGTYQDYSEEALANSNRTNLLFFHAPWCPQCRALERSIQNSELPANVAIFKIDYDSNQTLRQKYGVTIQTTVVKLNNQGEEEKKFVPYQDPTWDSVKKELL
jgi:thiol-disulfide isomerase/thioredoxin